MGNIQKCLVEMVKLFELSYILSICICIWSWTMVVLVSLMGQKQFTLFSDLIVLEELCKQEFRLWLLPLFCVKERFYFFFCIHINIYTRESTPKRAFKMSSSDLSLVDWIRKQGFHEIFGWKLERWHLVIYLCFNLYSTKISWIIKECIFKSSYTVHNRTVVP